MERDEDEEQSNYEISTSKKVFLFRIERDRDRDRDREGKYIPKRERNVFSFFGLVLFLVSMASSRIYATHTHTHTPYVGPKKRPPTLYMYVCTSYIYI